MTKRTILVTGATGYIGGRLVPLLLHKGYRVRALARSRSKLTCRPWAEHPELEIAECDLLDFTSLQYALQGCSTVYYLVHSMQSSQQEQERNDRMAAKNMALAATKQGVERIIYLSDLGEDRPYLSKHLRSRTEVGQILQTSTVPTTILRSSIILGSGSASFELIRYLTDRMPVIFAPKWMDTLAQPISIRNVLEYLAGCLENPQTRDKTYDIGGPDILTYADLFRIYTQEAGLKKRFLIQVPFLNAQLLSYFAHLLTPIPAHLAETLIDSFKDRAICKDTAIEEHVPQKLLNCREAISLALQKVNQDKVQTCWMDAGELEAPEWIVQGDISYARGTVLESAHAVTLSGTAKEIWPMLESIGGSRGWYGMDILWRIRGDMDKLVGGPGLRRGRRDQSRLQVGDALDFWRVLEVDPPRILLLVSEMKLPGEAMLEFKLEDLANDRVKVLQIARFLPTGLGGVLYWYLSYPLHGMVFKRMLLNISYYSGHSVLSGPFSICN